MDWTGLDDGSLWTVKVWTGGPVDLKVCITTSPYSNTFIAQAMFFKYPIFIDQIQYCHLVHERGDATLSLCTDSGNGSGFHTFQLFIYFLLFDCLTVMND
jgi:hypothetical protein